MIVPSKEALLFFCVVQQPKSGPGRLIVEVSMSQTDRHKHPVGLACICDQPVAEAATYTSHNKHKRRKSMSSEGFESAVPAIKRSQTYSLDRSSTGLQWLTVIHLFMCDVKCSDVEWTDVIYVKWFCFEVQWSEVKCSEVSYVEVLEDKRAMYNRLALYCGYLNVLGIFLLGVYLVLWLFQFVL